MTNYELRNRLDQIRRTKQEIQNEQDKDKQSAKKHHLVNDIQLFAINAHKYLDDVDAVSIGGRSLRNYLLTTLTNLNSSSDQLFEEVVQMAIAKINKIKS